MLAHCVPLPDPGPPEQQANEGSDASTQHDDRQRRHKKTNLAREKSRNQESEAIRRLGLTEHKHDICVLELVVTTGLLLFAHRLNLNKVHTISAVAQKSEETNTEKHQRLTGGTGKECRFAEENIRTKLEVPTSFVACFRRN